MSPTIDTLINTFSLFATVILGVFVFIGGLIVWNGIALRERAEKDLDKIGETKTRTEELEKSVQAIFTQTKLTLNTLAEEAQAIQKMVANLQESLEQVDIKDKKATALLSNLEQRTTAYSNTLRGSASILNSDNFVSSSQPTAFAQPTYPLTYPGIYGNPVTQPPDFLTKVVTQQNPFIVTGAEEVNPQNQNPLMDYLMSDAVPVVKRNPTP